jgi:hypothetical protein
MTIARDSRGWVRPGPNRALTRGFQRIALLVVTGLLVALQAPGEPQTLPPQPPDTSDIVGAVTLGGAGEVLPAPARAVRPGEFLRFSVRYGFINAGEATLEVPSVRHWKGRPVFNLVARAESNKFFSAFYKVQNRIESYWDTTGYYSRRFYENRREGSYHEQNEIVFDYRRGEAVYTSDGQKIAIPPNCQDALSSFYYTRTQALPLGGSVIFDYHASHKSQPIEVKVLGRQKVETPAGTFNCVVIEPILRAAGIFQNRGRLVIWLTDDDRRTPVMMKSKVTIGSISVVLIEARRG